MRWPKLPEKVEKAGQKGSFQLSNQANGEKDREETGSQNAGRQWPASQSRRGISE